MTDHTLRDPQPPLDAEHQFDPAAQEHAAEYGPEHGIGEDIGAFFDDGKTYIRAEIQYQKSRMAFAADRGKSGLVFLLGALGLAHLALIALCVGLVIALAPILTIWGALALVVGLLLVAAVFLGLQAKKRFTTIASVFESRQS